MTNLTLARGEDGIAVITWDMPGRSMNVMNDGSLGEFATAVDQALTDPDIKGVVITSAKPAFIAGADLDWLEAMLAGTPDQTKEARTRNLFDRFMDIHRLFRKIETANKPFVAAINGTALGGGFEVCLACHRRVATDDPRALLGLPETKVGLFPGFGGTQRYLRMLGALEALPLLLEGTSLSPAQALARGLVDEVAPAAELVARGKDWIRSDPAEALVKPWDKPGFAVPGLDPRTLAGVQAFSAANAMQRAKTYGNYPALDAIQSVVYRGMLVPLDTGLRIEAKAFAKLALDPRARNMVRTPRMISTNGIRSTGEKKCRPMKRSGRAEACASPVIGRVEVLLAKNASAPSTASAPRVTSALTSRFSNTASITSSASASRA